MQTLHHFCVVVFFSLVGVPAFAQQLETAAETTYARYPTPPKRGTFVRTAFSDPVSFNPLYVMTVSDELVGQLIYLPLLSVDRGNLKFFPALAEKVQISKDGKEYTYTLYEKARWSDGTPVTADDVEFTVRKIQDPAIGSVRLRLIFEKLVFTKIDSRRFKFKVAERRFNTATILNQFTPIQKKQFEKVADFQKAPALLNPVGNGPYRVKTILRGQEFTLERDSDWWARDLPQNRARFNFDLIRYKIETDIDYERFVQGAIDLYELSAEEFRLRARGKDADRVGSKPGTHKKVWTDLFPSHVPSGFDAIALNHALPIFSSRKTRQALAYLIPYDVILEKAELDTQTQAVSPFGSSTEYTAPELRGKLKYHLDPEKAQALLKEDGWVRSEGGEVLEKEIGGKKQPFRFTIGYPAKSRFEKIGPILQEHLKKQGIELKLNPSEWTVETQRFDEKNFEASWRRIGALLEPDPYPWYHSAGIVKGRNKMSYSNPEVDQLIERAAVEPDRQRRAKLIRQITVHLHDDVPFIFLVERSNLIYGLSSKVKSPVWIEKFGGEMATELYHE